MNRRVAERKARLDAMFPNLMELATHGYAPTHDEQIAFDRYGLSRESRLVALESARRCEATAAACYEAIRRSLA